MVALKIVNRGGEQFASYQIDPLLGPTINDLVAFRRNGTGPRIVVDVIDVIMDYSEAEPEIYVVVDVDNEDFE